MESMKSRGESCNTNIHSSWTIVILSEGYNAFDIGGAFEDGDGFLGGGDDDGGERLGIGGDREGLVGEFEGEAVEGRAERWVFRV